MALPEMDLLHGLDLEEIDAVRQRLVHRLVRKGEAICEEGETSRDFYLLSSGAVSIKIHLPETNSQKRVITYRPGAAFGEMAFLDGAPRSVGVWADVDSELLCLPHESFMALQEQRPEIAAKPLSNIALQLVKRLRTMNAELRVAEDR